MTYWAHDGYNGVSKVPERQSLAAKLSTELQEVTLSVIDGIKSYRRGFYDDEEEEEEKEEDQDSGVSRNCLLMSFDLFTRGFNIN